MSDDADRTRPQITVQANGPYLVRGDVAVTRRRIAASTDDEPITWETTSRFPEIEKAAALCRCGGSANKPYCDGTHSKNGFDGTATAPTTTYDERSESLGGEQVVVRDDRSLCEHAGFCGNRVTSVWDMAGESADTDPVVRSAMISMIEHCPSGALTYRLAPAGEAVEPELAPEVGVVDDGPLFVTGRVPVTLADGTAYEVRARMTLCRCGGSKNKPFCDGTHAELGFTDHG